MSTVSSLSKLELQN